MLFLKGFGFVARHRRDSSSAPWKSGTKERREGQVRRAHSAQGSAAEEYRAVVATIRECPEC